MATAVRKVSASFAEFGVRLFALGVDVLIISALMVLIARYGFGTGEVATGMYRAGLILGAPLYFVASWASPLRATPAQLLFGMRVVDTQGRRLTITRAALRGAVVIGLYVLILIALGTPANPLLQLAVIVPLIGVFLAAVTPNRQAVHDLLSGSIVVNRRALKDTARREQLIEHVADRAPATFSRRRPSILRMLVDTVVLLVPVILIHTVFSVTNDMHMRSRVAFAVGETGGLKAGLKEYWLAHERWPAVGEDIGAETLVRYPAGGYFRLEEGGAIRIRFEKRRELRSGSILLLPDVNGEFPEWTCNVDGYIARRYLPAMCRD